MKKLRKSWRKQGESKTTIYVWVPCGHYSESFKMAALLSEFRGGLGQVFQRARLLPRVYRIGKRSLAISSEGSSSSGQSSGSSSLPASAPQTEEEPFDNSTYKVNEYFSYNKDSYYDLEIEIDEIGSRQRQPDPSIAYKHTEPWKKEAKP